MAEGRDQSRSPSAGELLGQLGKSTPPNHHGKGTTNIDEGDDAATTTMATAMAMAMAMATAMAMAVAMATAAATARPYSCKPVGGLTRPVSGLLKCVYLLPVSGLINSRQPAV